MSDKRRRRLDPEQRRSEFLELGRELFQKHPYEALTIRRMATEMGVTPGLLYHYFPSKREFYIETVRDIAAQLKDRLEISSGGDPINGFKIMLAQYIEFALVHRSFLISLYGSGLGVDPEVGKVIDAVHRYTVSQIAGLLGREALAPLMESLLYGLVAMIEARTQHWLNHRRISVEELQHSLVNSFQLLILNEVPR